MRGFFLLSLVAWSLAATVLTAREKVPRAAGLLERFVAPPQENLIHHASTLTELNDGTVLCAWYGGSAESARDVQIFLSRLPRGAREWGGATVAVSAGERAEGKMLPNKSVGNPVLFRAGDNTIWLFYAALPFGGWSMAHVDYKTSTDGGLTWSASRTLINGIGHLPRGRPFPLDGTRILLPLYRESFGKRSYVVDLTLNGRRAVRERSGSIPGKSLQPALARLGQDEIVAYLRDPDERGILFSRRSFSRHEWSPAKHLALPNPGAAVDALTLSDRRILLAFNNDPDDRNPLSLAISPDGENFRVLCNVEKIKKGKFSYPTLLKAADGVIHLTYSFNRRGIKHVQLTEEWLRALEAGSP